MLNLLMRWLPLVVVIWIARKKCERVKVNGGALWAIAFKDVLVKTEAA